MSLGEKQVLAIGIQNENFVYKQRIFQKQFRLAHKSSSEYTFFREPELLTKSRNN